MAGAGRVRKSRDGVSVIAGIAAICALIGAAVTLIFSLLGFAHRRRVCPDAQLGQPSPSAGA
jgi:hypothetical protein